MTEANQLYEELAETLQPLLPGHRDVVEMLTVALLARGHVLIGGSPGLESTTVGATFARAVGLSSQRVRLTPDLDVAGLLGGPGDGSAGVDGAPAGRALTANVLRAEDVNRAPQRIQSALGEAMDEGQITVRGDAVELPRPFMVIATLNPVESEEVYGVPASHRDRFLFELHVDDLDREAGLALLDRYDLEGSTGADAVEPVADPEEVLGLQGAVEATYVDRSIKEYLLDVVLVTREHPDVRHGAATRASLSILRAVKALAAVRGRDYVIPDDVKAIAGPALAPRLVLTTEAELDDVDPRDVVEETLETVDPPGTEFEAETDDD